MKNKPADRIGAIIEGRMKKRLKELSLLDQMFIRNQDISIQDLINQNISVLGEILKLEDLLDLYWEKAKKI